MDHESPQRDRERGPAAFQTNDALLGALRIPQQGRVFSLALPRFHGMPLFASHPPFEVSMYRTPLGYAVTERSRGAQLTRSISATWRR